MIKKVIIIGGTPMIGKTTIARIISSKYNYCCISTDDIGESIRAIINNKNYNPMIGLDYIQYYENNDINELTKDVEIQHKNNWPAILAVINAHLNWGHPIIIEGWNFYPELVKEIKSDNFSSLWLLGNKEILKSRIENDKEFWINSKNPNLFKNNYINRSIWYNNIIKEQALKYKMKTINLNINDKIESIINTIDEYLKHDGSGTSHNCDFTPF